MEDQNLSASSSSDIPTLTSKNDELSSNNNASVEPRKFRIKKLSHTSSKRFERRYNRLYVYLSKPHVHFELLIAGFICTIIFLIFSMILLFTPSFITNGTYVPQQQFFNPYVGQANQSTTQAYGFNFGLYHYVFFVSPVKGNQLEVIITDINGLPKILGTFIGPEFNWYGIVYVCFEAFILAFVIGALVIFAKYNRFLKYDVHANRIRQYFLACFGLIICAIILGGVITEVNVIPGVPFLQSILVKLAPELTYPPVKTNGGAVNSALIEKYIADLNVNGKGVNFPLAVFATIQMRYVQLPTINDGNPAFWFKFSNSWWSWIFVAIYIAIMITCIVLVALLYTNTKKHKIVIETLTNENLASEMKKYTK